MIDTRSAVEQVHAAFAQSVTEACVVHGIPMLRVKKQDLPTVAYFLHVNAPPNPLYLHNNAPKVKMV